MKRFGATISEEEEEEEVVHIPSPYKVKPRSKFFCFLFSPFCFYRCKKLMLLFYSKFSILICAFVFLHPSWRKQNTIFNCQKNGGWVTAGASRNPPDALPVSSVFPFFSFSSLLLLYTEIYIKFLPFSYFLFFPGPPFELSTLQLSSGALEKTCAGCLTFSICVGTGHCLAKRRRRDPRDSVSRTLFGGRFILHPLSNYYNDF